MGKNRIMFGKNVDRYRKNMGISMEELGRRLNKDKSTISRWVKGERFPKIEEAEEIADFFNVSFETLIYGDQNTQNPDIATIYNQLEPPRQKKVYSFAEKELEDQNKVVSFPVYGKTAAGTSPVTYGDPDVEHKDFSSVPAGADVALVVSGDSMEPVISDGSIVFYKRQPMVENGEIAIVEIESDGVTCKRVKFDYENEKIILQSENDKYEDMVFSNDQVRILGKVLL